MNGPEHKQAPPPGYELNTYRLLEVLGICGFCVTYLVHYSTQDCLVAIKEYLPNTRQHGLTEIGGK